MKLLEILKAYNTYIKLHCPKCNGIMDSVFFDMEIGKMVYECRECGERFI